ncbi:MAG: DUF4173 domain-containing protein, partial [Clostridia bacterium]|nr:DUF4173 domain-containing protein [Clostridia bacterium]
CFLLCIMCFDGNTIGKTQGNRNTAKAFVRAICSVANLDITLKSLFSSGDGNKKMLGKVLIGVVCAVPLLIVIIPLLISSDAAFKGMMLKLFSNSFTTIIKVIIGIAVSVFVISYGFSLKKGQAHESKGINFAGIENVYVISFLSVITLCYLLYLFSQLAYFFSAFSGFLPADYSYADYARKGFFEMCVIAMINLNVVALSLILAKKNCGKVCVALKIITTFISAFTLLIIATAISKMVLYIDEYGMTVLRLGTSAFMVFLSVLFIALILKVYLSKINIVKTALITSTVIVMLLGTFNINAVCAKYNYESYKNGKLNNIDVYALYDLGDEGVPYLVRLAASKDSSIADSAKNCLAGCYWYDYFDNIENDEHFTVKQLKSSRKSTGFERYSIPRERAYAWLYKFATDNPDFDKVCYDYFTAQKQAQSDIGYFLENY